MHDLKIFLLDDSVYLNIHINLVIFFLLFFIETISFIQNIAHVGQISCNYLLDIPGILIPLILPFTVWTCSLSAYLIILLRLFVSSMLEGHPDAICFDFGPSWLFLLFLYEIRRTRLH